MKKLIARRKRLGITKPLLNPRVVVERKVRQSASDVVIICISGRSAGTGFNGMIRLRDTLRTMLTSAYRVNPDNIFSRSWNIDHDRDPRFSPLVNDLLREINRRTTNPSYLAIIGHSYGGWAACRLSKVTNTIPNFVGLVDPIFGIRNILRRPNDVPRGRVITNWFQDNGISIINDCLGIAIPCLPVVNGISCGFQNVPGAARRHVEFLRSADGTILRINCLGRRVSLRASHGTIDDDARVHRLIFNQINNDLSKIIVKK